MYEIIQKTVWKKTKHCLILLFSSDSLFLCVRICMYIYLFVCDLTVHTFFMMSNRCVHCNPSSFEGDLDFLLFYFSSFSTGCVKKLISRFLLAGCCVCL